MRVHQADGLLSLSYFSQERPCGVAITFLPGAGFIGSDRIALIVGDDMFCRSGLSEVLRWAAHDPRGATIFGSGRSRKQRGVSANRRSVTDGAGFVGSKLNRWIPWN